MPRNLLQHLKEKTRHLRREVFVIYLALKHPRTPWYAKALAVAVLAYALSPIDLIPDPIPVLGYLDDIIIVPLGVLAVRKLVGEEVMEACRADAESGVRIDRGWRIAGMLIIASIWIALLAAAALWISGWRR